MAGSSALSLQKSIYDVLVADGAINTLLGGAKIYDDVPRDIDPPFVLLGETVSRDWSTGTEDGEEHLLTVHVWARGGGKKLCQDLIAAIRNALHDKILGLADHLLINLRHEFADTRLSSDGEHYHGIVRYRAVTEPVAA